MKKIMGFQTILVALLFSFSVLAGPTTARQLTGSNIKNGSAILTLPTSTDVLAGRATSDTLTNKTMDGGSNTFTNLNLTTVVSNILGAANGGTGVNAIPTSAVASAFAAWDSNKNLFVNNLIESYSTTVTAAGTTTLTASSAYQQYFTGATTQTVLLPPVNTLVLGEQFSLVNNSSGVVTVQSSGGNTLQALPANTYLIATVVSTSGTGTASWSWAYSYQTGGTVSSVAMSVPSFLSISGSPITSTGTLAVTLSGTALPRTSGGTGQVSSWNVDGVIYASDANTLASTTSGSSGQALTSNGPGLAPTFQPAGVPSFSGLTQFAPTYALTTTTIGSMGSAGTAGQILKSAGSSAPVWDNDSVQAYRSVTTTDTATTADTNLILSGASFTETLFTAVGNKGKILEFVHNGSSSLDKVYTLATTSGQTICGVASGSYALYTVAERLRIISDNVNWQCLMHQAKTTWSADAATTWTATSAYVYTVTAANATIGAVYSHNGFNYIVSATIAAGTTLNTSGNGTPLTSGTLTKVSGTGDATITFSSRTITGVPVPGTTTANRMIWRRDGDEVEEYFEVNQTVATGAVAGSGNYILLHPSGIVQDMTQYTPTLVLGSNSVVLKAPSNVGFANGTYGPTSDIVVWAIVPYSSSGVRFSGTLSASGGTLDAASNFAFGTPSGSVSITGRMKFKVIGWQF